MAPRSRFRGSHSSTSSSSRANAGETSPASPRPLSRTAVTRSGSPNKTMPSHVSKARSGCQLSTSSGSRCSRAASSASWSARKPGFVSGGRLAHALAPANDSNPHSAVGTPLVSSVSSSLIVCRCASCPSSAGRVPDRSLSSKYSIVSWSRLASAGGTRPFKSLLPSVSPTMRSGSPPSCTPRHSPRGLPRRQLSCPSPASMSLTPSRVSQSRSNPSPMVPVWAQYSMLRRSLKGTRNNGAGGVSVRSLPPSRTSCR